MRSQVRIVAIVLSVVLSILSAGALAQANNDDEQVMQRITTVFPGSESDIQAMREAGYGWGIIIMILHLAELSPTHDVAGIRAMFESGKGFGEITEELNINPSELGRIVAFVMSEGRSEQGGAAAEERGKPDSVPGPPDPGRRP